MASASTPAPADPTPPAIRWRDGLIFYALPSVLAMLLVPITLFLATWTVVEHGHRIGLEVVKPVDATVVRTEYNGGSTSGRTRSCPGQWIHVRWSTDGQGKFRVCEDNRLAVLQPGDTVSVRPLPFFDEVAPEDQPLNAVVLVLIPVGMAMGVASIRFLIRLRRLTKVGPQGRRFHCEVIDLDPKRRTATLQVKDRDLRLNFGGGRRNPGVKLEMADVDAWEVYPPSRKQMLGLWVLVQGDRCRLTTGPTVPATDATDAMDVGSSKIDD